MTVLLLVSSLLYQLYRNGSKGKAMLLLIQITAIVIANAMGHVTIDVVIVIVAVIVINCVVLKFLSW